MRDDVIAAIYDAPLADKPWASLAPLLRSVVNASSVFFKFTPVGSTDDTILVADAEWEFDAPSDLYRRVYQYQDPTNYQHMSAGKFYRFEDLVARDVLQSSDYYTRFCKPLNIEHAFFCYFGCHDGIDAWLYGARDGARGAFSADEAQAIRGLLPHLDRSVQVYSRLERQRSETQIYGNTVAALGIGVVLLDRQGSIVSCNKEADAILAESSAVVRFENRLRLAGSARRHYAWLLEKLAADPAMQPQALVAGDASGKKVSLIIRRADEVIGRQTITGPAFVVYLKHGSQASSSRMTGFVAQNFGLTLVEAQLAILLSDGLAMDEIAARLGVTLTSARTYCKRVLAKTGASRQAELVGQVLTSLARLS
jgi:DNA-binding CsgD family transcriptional regulator/PAS domain-containing protein